MGRNVKSIDGLSGGGSTPIKPHSGRAGRNASPTSVRSRTATTPPRQASTRSSVTRQKAAIVPPTTEKTPKKSSSKSKSSSDDFLKPVKAYDYDFNSEDLKRDRRKYKGKKGKKPRKKWSKKRKILVVVGLILLALIAAFLIWLQILIANMTNGQSGVFDTLFSDGVDLKRDKNNRTNILIFGTSGYDMEGSDGDYQHDGAQLTDSIMLISMDQDTKDMAMLNIPRDFKVKEGCSAGKINEVYWCNNQDNKHEQDGANALAKTVEEITGTELHYYSHINWGSLVQVVDNIGGITVTLDEDIADVWTNTYIKAGVPTTLNGEQALGLARARHGTVGGDFTRGASQQKILVALEQQILQKGLGLTDAFNLMNTLGDNVRTSFKTDEIKRLVKIFKEYDLKNMRQVPLTQTETNDVNYVTSATINGISYIVPAAGPTNYTEIQSYLSKMFSSDPVKYEGAKISVLNGSSVTGAAGAERDKLTKDGYTVSYIGDAPGTYTGYTVYAVTDTKPGTKAALEKRYGVTVQPASSIPAGIGTTGFDFIIIVGDQPASNNSSSSSSSNTQ